MGIIIGIMIGAMILFLIRCLIWVSTPNVTKDFEKYQHHGKPVWVQADLRGRHRNHCLCFSCKRFHPGSEGNCAVAQTLYQLCLDHNLVIPVWECPVFKQDPHAADRKWNQ